ncbi:MAG: radical SAM protein [Myxococcota bacterium]
MANNQRRLRLGLIEVPTLGLIDTHGKNWTPMFRGNPLLSKQVLMAQLEDAGFEVALFNLKNGDYQEEIGQVPWKRTVLTKVYVGSRIHDLDPIDCDGWGVTANYAQEREVALLVVRHLASRGRPVVVGGSDALSRPDIYFEAGAKAVVTDKSGAATVPVFEHVLGIKRTVAPAGFVVAGSTLLAKRATPMSPQDWPVPSVDIARQCLGTEYSGERFLENLLDIGSIFPDIGCDRTCDFCQTPLYRTGYRRMTPERTLEWLRVQKEAGAGSTVMISDQFLARNLFPGGREEILEITRGAREMKMPLMWPNGLEVRKATLGRGRKNKDMTPDDELIEALWGWDGEAGCFLAYVPAERPVGGGERQPYPKVLPWQEHCDMMRRIVRAGIPAIAYGVIIGLPDDSEEDLLYLEEAIQNLYQELRGINPKLEFQVASYSISPILGTKQWDYLTTQGLLRFDDSSIVGEFWTATCDTHHLSYEEVSDWQVRLAEIGKEESNVLNYHGGLTVVPTGQNVAAESAATP